jgi:hypothetical protein
MPNHVTNILTIVGEEQEVQKCLSEIKGEREHIDFNTFAPIPDELKGTQSPVRIITQEEYDEQERRIANNELTDIEKSWGISRGITQQMSKEFIKKFGFDNWYGWQLANWNTKWNAYDQFISENVITFDTAWSTPSKAIVKLSAKYPTLSFEVKYADEDMGYNVGTYTCEGGEIINEDVPMGGSVEAMRMAMEIKGDEEYYLVNHLCEEIETEEDITEWVEALIELAHQEQYLVDEYPVVVLERLKQLALNDEQYERVAQIDNLLKVKTEDKNVD